MSNLIIPQLYTIFNPTRYFNCKDSLPRVIRRSDIPPGSKLVYSALLSFADRDGYCYPSNKTLAIESGLGIAQISRSITFLIKKRFIGRKLRYKDRMRTSNKYWFLWHPVFSNYQIDSATTDELSNYQYDS